MWRISRQVLMDSQAQRGACRQQVAVYDPPGLRNPRLRHPVFPMEGPLWKGPVVVRCAYAVERLFAAAGLKAAEQLFPFTRHRRSLAQPTSCGKSKLHVAVRARSE